MNPDFGSRVVAYLRLMRPANIITAIADILAGVSIAGISFLSKDNAEQVWWLVLSTAGLYGGGVVFNDVFDAELDKRERPERPIPRGLASIKGAVLLGTLLLCLGIFAASRVSVLSAGIAVIIAGLALAYDSALKHYSFFGPVTMGLCRAGTLLLGISIVNEKTISFWFLGIIPLVFVAAITLISKGEVHSGTRRNILAGAVMFLAVIIALTSYCFIPGNSLQHSSGFILLFSLFILIPLSRAMKYPAAGNIRSAVKFSVLSLIIMDAAITAGFSGWVMGLCVLALLPASLLLAKIFSVT